MVTQSRRTGLRLCKLFAWESRKIKGRIWRYLFCACPACRSQPSEPAALPLSRVAAATPRRRNRNLKFPISIFEFRFLEFRISSFESRPLGFWIWAFVLMPSGRTGLSPFSILTTKPVAQTSVFDVCDPWIRACRAGWRRAFARRAEWRERVPTLGAFPRRRSRENRE
jgi:hypothetical protein